MKRYFINIKHDGFVTMNKMMLDAENLDSAKKIVEGTMKEHNSKNSTILDDKFKEISEFRFGKWNDKED